MNRTKVFFYNSASTAVLQVITMLSGFIIPRVLLRSYGSEINGLVSSISQFLAYFTLVEAGLAGASVYSLYEPIANQNKEAINGIISAAKIFYKKAGYIFILFTVGFSLIYPLYIKSGAIDPYSIGLLVLVLGVNSALEFLTLAKYRVLLTADQKTYVISFATIVQVIANTLITVVLAELGAGIVVLKTVALFSIFLRSVILMIYCKKHYDFLNYKADPDKKSLEKRWDVLYLQILGAVQTGAPIVILTVLFKDLTLVSIYTIYNMVLSGLNGLLGIFVSGLAASFGDVLARKENVVLQKAYREFEFAYYSLITVAYSIAFVTIMPFIRIYSSGITDANYDLPLVGFLFCLNGLAYNIKTPQGMLVISAGMYRETRWQSTTQGAILAILGVVFSILWGIPGILAASILSNLYRDIDLVFFAARRITGLSPRTSILRILVAVFNTAAIVVPLYFLKINPTSYLTWILWALAAAAAAIAVVGLSNFVFERQALKDVLLRLRGLARVKK